MIATEQLNGVSGVYCAIHRNSGSTYVGSSVDMGARRASHCAAAMNRSSPNHFHKCLRQHGPDEFDFEVLERCPAADMKSREDFWISFLGSARGSGMNSFASSSWHPMSPMSDVTKCRIGNALRGKPKSEAHKLKMSIAKKREWLTKPRIPMSVELKAKLAAINVGHKPSQETLERMRLANIGKKHTEETKRKISQNTKGHKLSPETKARMSLAQKGKIVSLETGIKISIANKGRKVSDQTRKTMGIAQRAAWILRKAKKQNNLLASTKPVAVETAKQLAGENNKQK